MRGHSAQLEEIDLERKRRQHEELRRKQHQQQDTEALLQRAEFIRRYIRGYVARHNLPKHVQRTVHINMLGMFEILQ